MGVVLLFLLVLLLILISSLVYASLSFLTKLKTKKMKFNKMNLRLTMLMLCGTLLVTESAFAQVFGDGKGVLLNGWNANSSNNGQLPSAYFSVSNGTNFPGPNSMWHHFITYKHTYSDGYALQFSASYFNESDLYFRKIMGNDNKSWCKVATDGSNTFKGTQVFDNSTVFNSSVSFNDAFTTTGLSLLSDDADLSSSLSASQMLLSRTYSDKVASTSISADKLLLTNNEFEMFVRNKRSYDVVTCNFNERKFSFFKPVYIKYTRTYSTDYTKPTMLNIDAGSGTGVEVVASSSYYSGYTAKLYGGRFVISRDDESVPDFYVSETGEVSIGTESVFDGDSKLSVAGKVALTSLKVDNDWADGNPSLSVNEDGYVTLGTETVYGGDYLLSVNGKVACNALRVAGGGWADYVFEEGYNLRGIEDVEAFIAENKHLPDVPSADEVANEGIDVAEMQTIMMQKIEELTLYIIEQQKKISALECEMAKLK